MRVIVGCERSGIVRDEFIKLGHDAYSCDLEECDRDNNKHYQCSILDILHLDWDLGIFHPPCTYISKVSAPHLNELKYGDKAKSRLILRDEAIEFFKILQNAPIGKIAIENPTPFVYVTNQVGIYTQAIQPWQFGDQASKRTCLWLKNLPMLKPTHVTKRGIFVKSKNGTNAKWCNELGNKKDRQKIRSQTFPGIARAMAEQWTKQEINLFNQI